MAVLSLILAEAELLAERGPAPPLLLLDDVLSELDEGRRTALARRLEGPGQTLITATGASALPIEPAQLVQALGVHDGTRVGGGGQFTSEMPPR